MKTGKKNELDKDQQVDRMIDDGLGGGMVVEQHDKKKLKSEREKKEDRIQKEKDHGEKIPDEKINEDNSSMARNLEELDQLGKEMEHMKTNKELKESGKAPDPRQDEDQDK
jgi:hypothetical protein